MPDVLPDAPEEARQLSSRGEGQGYDTEVARFFGAEVGSPSEEVPVDEDAVPTLIDSADLGRAARARARARALEAQQRVPRGG